MSFLIPFAIWLGLTTLATAASCICGSRLAVERRHRQAEEERDLKAARSLAPGTIDFSNSAEVDAIIQEMEESLRYMNSRTPRKGHR